MTLKEAEDVAAYARREQAVTRLAEAARPCLAILRHKQIRPPMDEGVQQKMEDELRAALAAFDEKERV